MLGIELRKRLSPSAIKLVGGDGAVDECAVVVLFYRKARGDVGGKESGGGCDGGNGSVERVRKIVEQVRKSVTAGNALFVDRGILA